LSDTQRAVAPAVFADPDSALADWKAAVGADTTARSTLAPINEPATIRELLDDCLLRETFGGSVMGDEPIDLLSEYFRMRSRARQLSRSWPGHNADPHAAARWKADAHADTDEMLSEFGNWHRERHADRDLDEDATATLTFEWLGTGPRIARFSCSPHRIRMMTSFIWDSYEDDDASSICALLPEWVTWCAEKTGLTPALTDRSLAEAHRSTTVSRSTRDTDHDDADHDANPRTAE